MTKTELSSHFGNVVGTTTLGERGQIVIPKEAREKLKLKDGARFLVIEHHGKLVLVPEEIMSQLVKQITKHLNLK